MDIELADTLSLVDVIDHYVIFSGDGDFRTLVDALQRKGRKVRSCRRLPAAAEDFHELRRQADNFTDPLSLKNEIGREPGERPARRQEPEPDYDEDDL